MPTRTTAEQQERLASATLSMFTTKAGPRTRLVIEAWQQQRGGRDGRSMPHGLKIIEAIARSGLERETDAAQAETFVATACKMWLVVALEGVPLFLQLAVQRKEGRRAERLALEASRKTYREVTDAMMQYLRAMEPYLR